MSETGTSVGEISGQSKCINTCDFRPIRPFRIVTGSEDNTVAVFEGPPFKFKMTKQVCSYPKSVFFLEKSKTSAFSATKDTPVLVEVFADNHEENAHPSYAPDHGNRKTELGFRLRL